jgi:predicted molibdopterin-dependent oxidoreductase YjgC
VTSPSAPAGRELHFLFEGQPVAAGEGQTIAAALYADGHRTLRYTSRRGEPRGLFCGMGICYDCLVEVNGQPNVRACQTLVAQGIQVNRQRGNGAWEATE